MVLGNLDIFDIVNSIIDYVSQFNQEDDNLYF